MKKNRQNKIIELIQAIPIETQEDLALLLQKEGFQVTQATVSRDIRELGLRKAKSPLDGLHSHYVLREAEQSFLGERSVRVLKEGFVSMDNAQNILVIKTHSGMAMAVAAALDDMKIKEVVGVIAGDDTVMAAIKTIEDTVIVMDQIKALLV